MTKHVCFAVVVVATVGMVGLDMPLVVNQLVTGPSSHVRVSNTGQHVISAWSFAITSTDGVVTHRVVHTADAYLSEITHGLPQSSTLLERIPPGDSREFPLDPLPQGAAIDVIAVVNDDGSAIGDEGIISEIFARRVKERDALRSVVETFTEVLQTQHGTAALAALRDRFTALLQRDESIPCRAALDTVQTYPRTASPKQIDQSLNTYAAFVTREYDLAVKQSVRKPI
ncbi:MAG TPA: hypothetical protein VGY48_06870 [Vicinamibacterales bacterium]|nr:hypothetical protein [Vicinamibacterales bacterium]